MKKYLSFFSENFQFLQINFSIYLNRRVFVMKNMLFFFLIKNARNKLFDCDNMDNYNTYNF